MRRLEAALIDGLAGYAIGRLISVDTVSMPLMNRVLRLAIRVKVPTDLFDRGPHADALNDAVRSAVVEDEAAGNLDHRALWNMGWAEPLSPIGKWFAEMVTCPTCSSFHATWVVRLARGSWRVWEPGWWVAQFAAWAVAQTAVRLPFNASGQATERDYIARAVEAVEVAR